MADNLNIKDGGGLDQQVRTTEVAGVHTPHQNANLRVLDSPVTVDNPVAVCSKTIDNILGYLKQIVYTLSNSLGNIDAFNRLKVRAEVVDIVTTVSTVTTVTGVTNMTNLAGMPQAEFGIMTSLDTFSNAIRNKVSF